MGAIETYEVMLAHDEESGDRLIEITGGYDVSWQEGANARTSSPIADWRVEIHIINDRSHPTRRLRCFPSRRDTRILAISNTVPAPLNGAVPPRNVVPNRLPSASAIKGNAVNGGILHL